MYKALLSFTIFIVAFYHSHAQVSYKAPDSNTIYTFVEQNPVFPGGDEALMKFLQKNVMYPEYEKNNDIQGKVIVKFVIDTFGKATNITIVRGVSPGIDSETVRVINILPRFKPGRQQGKPVRVWYNLPIVFKLDDPAPTAVDEVELMNKVAAKYEKKKEAKAAVLLYGQRNYKSALPQFIRLAEKTSDGMVYAMVANCYWRLKDSENRCKMLKKAIELGFEESRKVWEKECGKTN